MSDLPILFSAPMVRAIIAGRKRQTRRIVTDVPAMPEADCHRAYGRVASTPYLDAYCSEKKTPQNPRGMSRDWCWWQVDDRQCLPTFRVKAKPGDRLWVREAWRTWRDDDELSPRDLLEVWENTADAGPPDRANVEYVADGEIVPPISIGWDPGRLRASMHLPRAYSRITLIVTDVRVQRLQDISEEDVVAEGVERLLTGRGYYDPTLSHEASRAACRFGGWYRKGVDAYAALWNHINGAGAWERNPWVAAYTFDPVLCNIDHMEAANV